ncbi:MAG TPA: nuclear transport factor 2 family protein [Steroidobacteraceae bacterium]|nr:nuclear transport factor 2 family protein [Steroidobacteraceae bacterium]
MTERAAAERMVRELHTARLNGDLAGMCRLFADHGRFEIAGASADKPIAIRAEGIAEFRPWLAIMTKVFRLSDYRLLSLIVEWPKLAAHWHTNIYSKVTGVTVSTELVDLMELRDDRIQTYSEFFVPR